ncbi:hypothetical protein AYO22_09488 [Fonsecaea multimorphosa]|nr:hypothetical protein AYO22_09488 [Fonsecaea multimorphosa]
MVASRIDRLATKHSVFLYWGMQDVIDEALQRLYWACRQGRGFPGVIPDESSGRVSTDAILRGLGLSPPAVDNTRMAASRSDSVLETQNPLHRPQSYHPPDFPPPDLSRTKTASSAVTRSSTTGDDRLTFAEATTDGASRRGKQTSAMEVDGEEEEMSDGIPDSLPDGFAEQFQGSLGSSIDPAMLQDGHVDLTAGSLYPNMSVMDFAGRGRPGMQGQRMPTQAAAGQFQVDGLPEETFGAGGQQRWQGRGHEIDGMLPWPGNMASMYRGTRQDEAGGGFDDHVDGER